MSVRGAFTMSRQQGAALLVSLILLVVLSLLGVAAMQSSQIQERLSGAYRNKVSAFQAAEAALRAAEEELEKVTPFSSQSNAGFKVLQPDVDCVGLCYDEVSNPDVFINYGEPLNGNPWDKLFPNTAFRPHYIVEEIGLPGGNPLVSDEPLPDTKMYRITAKAYGDDLKSISMLQTYFRRQ